MDKITVLILNEAGVPKLTEAVRELDPDVIIGPEYLRGTGAVQTRVFCPIGAKEKMLRSMLDIVARENVTVQYLVPEVQLLRMGERP